MPFYIKRFSIDRIFKVLQVSDVLAHIFFVLVDDYGGSLYFKDRFFGPVQDYLALSHVLPLLSLLIRQFVRLPLFILLRLSLFSVFLLPGVFYLLFSLSKSLVVLDLLQHLKLLRKFFLYVLQDVNWILAGDVNVAELLPLFEHAAL